MDLEAKEFLTVKDIAELLSLSQNTVRELLKSGAIKAKKVAGKYITTKALLKEFIESEGQ